MGKIVLAATIFLIVISVSVYAKTISDITYPVPQLGNCASESDCRTYCNQPDHFGACTKFAKDNQLNVSDIAQPIAELGGCKGADECIAYCNNVDHLDACINYAEAHGMMTKYQADEARKVLPFLKSGQTPGGCKSAAECKLYCDDNTHLEECINFAEKAGFITSDEAKVGRKFAQLGGKGPGGCTNKETCEKYCKDTSHLSECADFAHKLGVIDDATYEKAKKFVAVGGVGPGGCTTEQGCMTYCQDASHLSECVEFAHKAGFISEQDYNDFKKYGEKLSGKCNSRLSCIAYCIQHYQDCGISAPAGVDVGKVMAACQQRGISIDDCQNFCMNNPEACGISISAPAGFDYKKALATCQAAGVSPSDCQSYCQSNPDACGIPKPASQPTPITPPPPPKGK